MFCVTVAFGPHGAQNAFASVLIDIIVSKNQLEINKNRVLRGHNLCLFSALGGPSDAICAHFASSADPLGGPYYYFSILHFVPAIAAADPGPPTSGATEDPFKCEQP